MQFWAQNELDVRGAGHGLPAGDRGGVEACEAELETNHRVGVRPTRTRTTKSRRGRRGLPSQITHRLVWLRKIGAPDEALRDYAERIVMQHDAYKKERRRSAQQNEDGSPQPTTPAHRNAAGKDQVEQQRCTSQQRSIPRQNRQTEHGATAAPADGQRMVPQQYADDQQQVNENEEYSDGSAHRIAADPSKIADRSATQVQGSVLNHASRDGAGSEINLECDIGGDDIGRYANRSRSVAVGLTIVMWFCCSIWGWFENVMWSGALTFLPLVMMWWWTRRAAVYDTMAAVKSRDKRSKTKKSTVRSIVAKQRILARWDTVYDRIIEDGLIGNEAQLEAQTLRLVKGWKARMNVTEKLWRRKEASADKEIEVSKRVKVNGKSRLDRLFHEVDTMCRSAKIDFKSVHAGMEQFEKDDRVRRLQAECSQGIANMNQILNELKTEFNVEKWEPWNKK